MTAPDWLSTRDGGLAKGLSDRTLMVTLNGHPQWRLDAGPAKGKFTCAVMQTNNGQRLDTGKEYPTQEAALAGGLEELRAKLGW
ncbi:MAG TPA: hypothetical protein VHR66_12305 [Gemmataceae bacterium]|jgi:hypothetical protein|nr:hypothetical protein [Gemmataceae bacterium]